jgi:hypothetical protein
LRAESAGRPLAARHGHERGGAGQDPPGPGQGASIPDTRATDAAGHKTFDPAAALDGILLPMGATRAMARRSWSTCSPACFPVPPT